MRVLSEHQKRTFVHDGYLVVPQLVPPSLVASAIKGLGPAVLECDTTPNRDYWNRGETASDLNWALFDPLEESAHSLAVQILGKSVQFKENQLAIRFSGDRSGVALHIDGFSAWPQRTYTQEVPEFQLLLGVALDDGMKEDRGALRVYPGGHLQVQNFFRAKVQAEKVPTTTTEWDFMREELYQLVSGKTSATMSLKAGDAVLCHSLLPHQVGPNMGECSRAVLYLRCGNYSPTGLGALIDIWRDWPGLSDITQ